MKVSNQTKPGIQSTNSSKKSGIVSGLDKDLKKSGESAISASDLSSSARVDMSPRAKEMTKAREIAMNAPDVDEAKVSKFQNLIDKGLYKVDAKAVADRLVDDHALEALGESSND